MKLQTRRARLRAVGYHGTPAETEAAFARQLDHFAKHYVPLDAAGLDGFFAGAACGDKPAVLLTFDDGLSSNFEIAAPLLEERGMRGFFFVTTGLLDSSAPREFCAEHEIILPPGEDRGMTWGEVRELASRGHAIGCHTASHFRMRGPVAATRIAAEIREAKARLEEGLSLQIRHFAWVGGEPDTYDPEAMAAIRGAGFDYAFTTQSELLTKGGDSLLLHRTILDAGMSYGMFRIKIAGLSDLLHRRRRQSIEASLLPILEREA